MYKPVLVVFVPIGFEFVIFEGYSHVKKSKLIFKSLLDREFDIRVNFVEIFEKGIGFKLIAKDREAIINVAKMKFRYF